MEAKFLAEEVYRLNVENYSGVVSNLRKRRSNLGWLRLLSIVVMSIAAYYGFSNNPLSGWIIIIVGITVFLFLVSLDVKNNEKIYYFERLLFINKEELKILGGQYQHREDGSAFLPHDHPYAADLDIFGESSIYQYINRCNSDQGKALLASNLLTPLEAEMILQRQEATQELRLQVDWRQKFQSAGIANPITLNLQKKVITWLNSVTPYSQAYWPIIVTVYSIITLICLTAFVLDILPWSVFSILVFVFFTISLLISRKINDTYSALSKIVDGVETLRQQLQHFEGLRCNSKLLIAFQDDLKLKGQASANIFKLKRILDRFDYRLNVLVFFVLNTFLLWDLRQMISLNNWKNENIFGVEKWINAITNIEILNSFSTLTYNHPDWSFPYISKNHFTIEATEIGHPLIREDNRVCNSFSLTGVAKVGIITGSNMAGKSTFLRSIGVNLVLAHMGAPVCAKAFVFSPVNLYSSMRISDNLAENTSTFYAELKKLKTIIDKVNAQEKIFILLDEILRGTNSLDKHKGSEALIKQFVSKEAVAIIATHDVELGNLQKEFRGHIENYFFDVQVAGEELYFDYKIKRGICQSMNASLLMKKIGIEI